VWGCRFLLERNKGGGATVRGVRGGGYGGGVGEGGRGLGGGTVYGGTTRNEFPEKVGVRRHFSES